MRFFKQNRKLNLKYITGPILGCISGYAQILTEEHGYKFKGKDNGQVIRVYE